MKRTTTVTTTFVLFFAIIMLTACGGGDEAKSESGKAMTAARTVHVSTPIGVCRATVSTAWNVELPEWLTTHCVKFKNTTDKLLYQTVCADRPVLKADFNEVKVLAVNPGSMELTRCGLRVYVNHPPKPDAVNKIPTQEIFYYAWEAPTVDEFNKVLDSNRPLESVVSVLPQLKFYTYCVNNKADCFYN